MTTIKILMNDCVSDPDATWYSADITDMYLIDNPLDETEYMWINLADMTTWAQDHFKVNDFIKPGATSVLARVTEGIYGLPQAGRLAQIKLREHLTSNG